MTLLVPALSVVSATVCAILALLGYRFAGTPGWRDQRWFWLLALSAALYSVANVVITLDVPDYVITLSSQGNYAFIALHVAAWFLHSAAHLHRPLGVVGKAAVGLCLTVSAAALVPGLLLTDKVVRFEWLVISYGQPLPTAIGQGVAFVLCVCFLLPLVSYARALRENPDAAAYFAGMLILLAAGINDAVAGSTRYSMPFVLDAAFIITVNVIGFVLVRRFVQGAHRLEALSTRLEALVNNRTLELGEAYEALGRAERLAALGRLAAGVAHEINNPAAAVVTNLTYLETIAAKDSSLSTDAMEALRDSHESMERIARIVRQLLDTGRVASSAVKNAHAVNVADAVAEAVQTAHASVAKDLEITVDVSADLAVIGEPLTLGQVLVNLIANAAHAVRPNTPASNGRIARIEVRAERRTHGTRKPGEKPSGTRVQITVADNGGGMAPAVARRLFEPFFSTKPFGAGTGLGLSVSLGLVRAVGGDIRIGETSDQGTTMIIELLEAAPGVPTITAVTPSVTGI